MPMGKGTRREQQACDIYEAAGFETYRPATVQYGENDIYGLFDLIAFGAHPEPYHYVQVKSNRAAGINQWAENALHFATEDVRVRMLVCHDNEGWRALDPVPGGYNVVYDGRDNEQNMGDGLTAFLEP